MESSYVYDETVARLIAETLRTEKNSKRLDAALDLVLSGGVCADGSYYYVRGSKHEWVVDSYGFCNCPDCMVRPDYHSHPYICKHGLATLIVRKYGQAQFLQGQMDKARADYVEGEISYDEFAGTAKAIREVAYSYGVLALIDTLDKAEA